MPHLPLGLAAGHRGSRRTTKQQRGIHQLIVHTIQSIVNCIALHRGWSQLYVAS